MDLKVEMLRDMLHKLLDKEKIIASEEILKISKELDSLTVRYFNMQTEDLLENKNDSKCQYI